MENRDLKILCVDDDTAILDLYEIAINNAGFTPITISDPSEAVKRYRTEIPNLILVISDLKMPEMDGFSFRKSIMQELPAVPFIIASAYVTKEMALQALDLKISAFLDKNDILNKFDATVLKEATPRIQAIREGQALEKIFYDEATSILDDMEPTLLSLDLDRNNQDSINAIFRAAHTLKGSSGCLDCDTITRYVHKYEDIISSLKKGQLVLTDEIYEILFKGLDRIKILIASIPTKTLHTFNLDKILHEVTLESNLSKKNQDNNPKVAPTVAAIDQAKSDTQKSKDTISVPIKMLDELSGYSGEITVIRNMVNKIVRSLEMRYVGNKDIQSLGELLDEMHKINSTIQISITELRKVPLSGVLKPIPRILRDLSRDLGKSIKLTIEGESLRVDNASAIVCSNSLVHLVRNSADHGIETPSERRLAGKKESGTVNITCIEDHDEVKISIADDGRGIDHRKIRAKALEKGIFSESQLAAMNEQEALSIIFASGFSTAAQVTDVSGRGVGMDMVRSSVEAVGGRIDIDSKPGLGSTFTLRLPIPKSVLIINSLLVKSGDFCFAIPQDSIIRILRFEKTEYLSLIQYAATGPVLRCDNTIYSLVELKFLLKLQSDNLAEYDSASSIEILIVESSGLNYALRVDEILDSEEIVVKRLQSCFNPLGVFAGSTFMGDGTIGLIIDIGGLAELAGLTNASSGSDRIQTSNLEIEPKYSSPHFRNYLLFNLGTSAIYGAPLEQVFRLEEIDSSTIQHSGAERVVIYRDRVMPIFSVQRLLKLQNSSASQSTQIDNRLSIIVAQENEGYIGYEVSQVVDITSTDQEISNEIRDRIGVSGNAYIRDLTVTILDLPSILQNPFVSAS